MTPRLLLRAAPVTRRPAGAALLAVAGLVLVAAGAVLPWVSIHAGLAPIPGYQLDGGPLAGLAMAAGGLLLAGNRMGGERALRAGARVRAPRRAARTGRAPGGARGGTV